MELDNVLALSRLGLRLMPVMERNKIPILGAWQKRATTDEATLRIWHTQYVNCNWGIACGEESGIFVVDLDPKNGGDQSWKFLQDENEVPETWTVKTGSGGYHLYFAWPKGAEIRNSSNKIGRGIDVRATNGQVLAPGSIHPNGEYYQWEKSPSDVSLAKAPKWLLDLIKEETDQDFVPLGGELEKGSRNNSIFHVALALARQGVDKDFAVNSIKNWLIEKGQNDIDMDEIVKTVDSAYDTAKNKPVDLADRSDVMNAELLIQTYGQDLLYISGMGWFFWSGKYWEPDPDNAIVSQLFISCMKALQEEAAKRIGAANSKLAAREAAALASWAVRSLSASAIANAVSLASTFPQVRHKPDEVDGPDTLWLLNCNNGTVDLQTGQLYPHKKTDMITKMVPHDYDPSAKAPFWEETLNLIFDKHPHIVPYVQKALGYSITGSQDERCFFICWGESGANGKSTILESIQEILGPGYSQMSDMTVITSPTTDNRVSSSLAKLQGARFVSMNEAEENQKLSEALVKQMTGGDTVQACYKYKNPFEYRPVFKLWIRTNERPVIRSQTDAIWDRIKLIPFEHPIPKEKRLPRSLVDKKLKEEAPGILAWLIQGALLWKSEGLSDPEEVTMAVQGYRVDSNVVNQFYDECVEVGGKVKASDLYQAFVSWSKDSGEKYIMTKTKFTQRFKAAANCNTERTNGQTYFLGVKLNAAAAMYTM